MPEKAVEVEAFTKPIGVKAPDSAMDVPNAQSSLAQPLVATMFCKSVAVLIRKNVAPLMVMVLRPPPPAVVQFVCHSRQG